jgi:hypothetical protein
LVGCLNVLLLPFLKVIIPQFFLPETPAFENPRSRCSSLQEGRNIFLKALHRWPDSPQNETSSVRLSKPSIFHTCSRFVEIPSQAATQGSRTQPPENHNCSVCPALSGGYYCIYREVAISMIVKASRQQQHVCSKTFDFYNS